jgi:hypothetical protein
MFGGVAAAVVSMLIACSSSSGGSSSIPSCLGPPATGADSPVCSTCVQNQCASLLHPWESDCSAYLSCYAACQCSDLTCKQDCLSKKDSACNTSEAPITMCVHQQCSSDCTGTPGFDGGAD